MHRNNDKIGKYNTHRYGNSKLILLYIYTDNRIVTVNKLHKPHSTLYY